MQLNVAVGLVLGLIVMLAAVAFVEYLDDGINDREDIEALGVPFLGTVFQASVPKGEDKATWVPSIINAEPGDPLVESYRQVQASLAFALMAGDVKVLLVTSPGQGEGKSTTAANLAEALAESSKRVLLIDGDLRKPDAHRYFSLPNASGLTSTFLVDPQSLPAFVNRVGDSLAVLTGGPVAPNPTELLSSRKMRATVTALAEPFDIVVVDCPPLLGLADASLWMPLVDGVLLVARRGRTRRGPLEEAINTVRAARKPLVGVVLNGADRRGAYRYAQPYGYGYKAKNSEQ
jgi:capsular exopolysaccharide synthesis family protein